MRIKNKRRARSFMQVRSSRSRSKRGVSPVIGVILMVAATIVIAGVVMAMLGGFSAPAASKSVAFTTTRLNNSAVEFTLARVEPPGATISYFNWSGDGTTPSSTTTATSIGDVFTVSTTKSPAHIVITAKFGDGTTQVVYDQRI